MFKKEVLKKHLEDNDISHGKFAEMIGCSQQFVSYMISGFKQPSLALLGRICKATGLSADELIGEGE